MESQAQKWAGEAAKKRLVDIKDLAEGSFEFDNDLKAAFRAGCEYMRERAAEVAQNYRMLPAAHEPKPLLNIANLIRALPIPEEPNV